MVGSVIPLTLLLHDLHQLCGSGFIRFGGNLEALHVILLPLGIVGPKVCQLLYGVGITGSGFLSQIGHLSFPFSVVLLLVLALLLLSAFQHCWIFSRAAIEGFLLGGIYFVLDCFGLFHGIRVTGFRSTEDIRLELATGLGSLSVKCLADSYALAFLWILNVVGIFSTFPGSLLPAILPVLFAQFFQFSLRGLVTGCGSGPDFFNVLFSADMLLFDPCLSICSLLCLDLSEIGFIGQFRLRVA